MNSMIVVALFCLSGLAFAEDDGSWKGEGLLESQDYGPNDDGQYIARYVSPYYRSYVSPYYAGLYHYGAPLAHDGRVVDTPEVAQAKAAHFAAHAAATHGAVVLTHGGKYLQDTPEVAQAKAAHFAAHAVAAHGVPAHVELSHDGKYLKDTPEVAHAKAAHFAAHAAASNYAYPYPYVYHY